MSSPALRPAGRFGLTAAMPSRRRPLAALVLALLALTSAGCGGPFTSTANGVTSNDYGAYDGSFTIVNEPPED